MELVTFGAGFNELETNDLKFLNWSFEDDSLSK